ncbi:hypothetical protein V6N11_044344 [Hibiscus sabdariffa]|uniref:Uncharacterized protein n=1 Tax=Hibiscus sabdariffa TaxID=183260 RepID=A0ABR2RFC2_9ROSI
MGSTMMAVMTLTVDVEAVAKAGTKFLLQCFHFCVAKISHDWRIVCCVAVVWSLWLARNDLLFNRNQASMNDILSC